MPPFSPGAVFLMANSAESRDHITKREKALIDLYAFRKAYTGCTGALVALRTRQVYQVEFRYNLFSFPSVAGGKGSQWHGSERMFGSSTLLPSSAQDLPVPRFAGRHRLILPLQAYHPQQRCFFFVRFFPNAYTSFARNASSI